MKTDYPELEGKEIKYIRDDEKVFSGIIAGVNYHVGISVVNKEDKDVMLVCLSRKDHYPRIGGITYRKYFQNIIKHLKEGKYIIGDYAKGTYKASGGNPIASDCPFRQ